MPVLRTWTTCRPAIVASAVFQANDQARMPPARVNAWTPRSLRRAVAFAAILPASHTVTTRPVRGLKPASGPRLPELTAS